MVFVYLHIYRYECLWYPFYRMFVFIECDGDHIKETLQVSADNLLGGVEVPKGGLGQMLLLCRSDIVLRRSLDILLAGLDFYKMYSIVIDGDYVDFKVAASEVSFEYRMT